MNTKRITLCGSSKYKTHFDLINKQLSLEGHIVYSVAYFGHIDKIPPTDEEKETLDKVHKSKIDNSDAILVIDVDGYIGDSTKSEIQYAKSIGKTVHYLSGFPDLMMICDSHTLNFKNQKKSESGNIERMDDLLIEVDKRLGKLAKQISNDNLIDDDVSGGYLQEPEKSYVEELFSIGNYIDDNRTTPTEINNESNFQSTKQRYKSMPLILKILGISQLLFIITFLITPFIWIWYDWSLACKFGLTQFVLIWAIGRIDKFYRKSNGIK